jgi:hypothetical protein
MSGRRLSLLAPRVPVPGGLRATGGGAAPAPAHDPATGAAKPSRPCALRSMRPCGLPHARTAARDGRQSPAVESPLRGAPLHLHGCTRPPFGDRRPCAIRASAVRRPEPPLRERDWSLRATADRSGAAPVPCARVYFGPFCISGLYNFRVARLKPGTFSSIRAGPWAEGSARGPARHGPNLIMSRADPKLNVPSLFGLGSGRAGRPECTPIAQSMK